MAIKTHIRSRNAFSFKKHLEKQGVTTREGFRYHLDFVANAVKSNPRLSLRRYKVDRKNPNGGTYHG
jgi:hypothetical protein